MSIIQKTLFKQNLDRYTVFLQDTDPTSKYFKITQLPNVFTGGKNAFLIQGSTHLIKDSNILIEIKDSTDNVIYHEPIKGFPEYYEGTSKPVAVHIYPDTSFGPCTITILGELFEYELGGIITTIPNNWKGRYNVKWQATVNVNPTLANVTPIRFYKRPTVEIIETALPIYNVEKTYDTFTSYVRGASVVPVDGTRWPYEGETIYRLTSLDSDWPNGLLNTIIDVNDISIAVDTESGVEYYQQNPPLLTPTITQINSSKTVTISTPYVRYPGVMERGFPRISNFDRGLVGLTYESGSTFTNSGISSSYVRINISDLDTFSGDIYRMKIFSKSKNDLQGYKILEDIVIESKEFLETDFFLNIINRRTGVFDIQQIITNFWDVTPINSTGTALIDSTNQYGFQNVLLVPTNTNLKDSKGLFKFEYNPALDFTKDTEYIISFTPTFIGSDNRTGILEVYASGSLSSSGSAFVNTSNEYELGKKIIELNATTFRKYDRQSLNFKADRTGPGKISFNIRSGQWALNDVSLKPAKQSSFTPNEISILTNPKIQIVSESFDFRFEFFDINYNYVPIKLERTATFQGGNDIIPRLVVTITESGSLTPITSPVFVFTGDPDQGSPLSAFPPYFDIKLERFNTEFDITIHSSSLSAPNRAAAYDTNGVAPQYEINPQETDGEWNYPAYNYPGALNLVSSTNDTKIFRLTWENFYSQLTEWDRRVGNVKYYVQCGTFQSPLNKQFFIAGDYQSFTPPTTTTSTTTTTTTINPNYCPFNIFAYYTASFT